MSKRNMPSKAQIIDNWIDRLVENDKYWMEAYFEENCTPKMIASVCFACGAQVGTERAHIVPKQFGGGDDVENLHLLCKECHLESEPIHNLEEYLDWFDMKTPETSGSWMRVQNSCRMMMRQIANNKLEKVPPYMLKHLLTIYKDTESLIAECKKELSFKPSLW